MSEQIPYTLPPFPPPQGGLNPEPRCACVLLLDVSGSMQGEPIDLLNAALPEFKADVFADTLARKRIEVALITFGRTVELVTDFAPPENFDPPALVADGLTPMGEAINRAIDLVEERKRYYKRQPLSYFRPWIVLISDGEPTDGDLWKSAASRVHRGEVDKSFLFFAIGVEDSDMDVLNAISSKPSKKLRGLRFRELFLWLSASLNSVSQSSPGDKIALPSTTGWEDVEL